MFSRINRLTPVEKLALKFLLLCIWLQGSAMISDKYIESTHREDKINPMIFFMMMAALGTLAFGRSVYLTRQVIFQSIQPNLVPASNATQPAPTAPNPK